MVRAKDEEKRLAIRNAVIAEVIEGGLAGASVARIAKRAAVSAGTIYLYFPNKEALLQQVYLEIKTDFHAQMMTALSDSRPSDVNLRAMWFSMFSYLCAHPNDFLFSEYVGAAQVLDTDSQAEVTRMSAQISEVIGKAIQDGTLAPAPIDSILALLVSPVIYLVRKSIVMGKPVGRKTLTLTYDMIWKAIAAS